MPSYTFKRSGWETIEWLWFLGSAPARRICVSGTHPLRLLVGPIPLKTSTDGCIDYGGIGAVALQQVQARGQRGETISFTQTVPPTP